MLVLIKGALWEQDKQTSETRKKAHENYLMCTISGLTAGGTCGKESRVPPKAFHREIFIDLQGKERQFKKRKRKQKIEKKCKKIFKRKVENLKWKWEKV